MLVLFLLNEGKYISEDYLIDILGCSSEDIKREVKTMTNYPIKISFDGNRGYRAVKLSDALNLKDFFSSDFFNDVMYLGTTESSLALTKIMAILGVEESTLVVYKVPIGDKDLMEYYLIMYPDIPLSDRNFVNLCVLVAAEKALATQINADIMISWPNNICLNGIPVASVGSYTVVDDDGKIDYLICKFEAHNLYYVDSAEEYNINRFNEFSFLNNMADVFNSLYAKLCGGDYKFIINRWIESSLSLGSNLEVLSSEGSVIAGRSVGLNSNGCLVLETDDGFMKLDSPDAVVDETCSVKELLDSIMD